MFYNFSQTNVFFALVSCIHTYLYLILFLCLLFIPILFLFFLFGYFIFCRFFPFARFFASCRLSFIFFFTRYLTLSTFPLTNLSSFPSLTNIIFTSTHSFYFFLRLNYSSLASVLLRLVITFSISFSFVPLSFLYFSYISFILVIYCFDFLAHIYFSLYRVDCVHICSPFFVLIYFFSVLFTVSILFILSMHIFSLPLCLLLIFCSSFYIFFTFFASAVLFSRSAPFFSSFFSSSLASLCF